MKIRIEEKINNDTNQKYNIIKILKKKKVWGQFTEHDFIDRLVSKLFGCGSQHLVVGSVHFDLKIIFHLFLEIFKIFSMTTRKNKTFTKLLAKVSSLRQCFSTGVPPRHTSVFLLVCRQILKYPRKYNYKNFIFIILVFLTLKCFPTKIMFRKLKKVEKHWYKIQRMAERDNISWALKLISIFERLKLLVVL